MPSEATTFSPKHRWEIICILYFKFYRKCFVITDLECQFAVKVIQSDSLGCASYFTGTTVGGSGKRRNVFALTSEHQKKGNQGTSWLWKTRIWEWERAGCLSISQIISRIYFFKASSFLSITRISWPLNLLRCLLIHVICGAHTLNCNEIWQISPADNPWSFSSQSEWKPHAVSRKAALEAELEATVVQNAAPACWWMRAVIAGEQYTKEAVLAVDPPSR